MQRHYSAFLSGAQFTLWKAQWSQGRLRSQGHQRKSALDGRITTSTFIPSACRGSKTQGPACARFQPANQKRNLQRVRLSPTLLSLSIKSWKLKWKSQRVFGFLQSSSFVSWGKRRSRVGPQAPPRCRSRYISKLDKVHFNVHREFCYYIIGNSFLCSNLLQISWLLMAYLKRLN